MEALSRRFAAALSAAVVLAGGVAFAQSDLIVDPWKRALVGSVPAAAGPVAPATPNQQRADSGWFDDAPGVAVAPKSVVRPRAPGAVVLAADPWVERAPAAPPPAPLAAPPQPLHPGSWARVVPEIIDPWGPRKLAVYRDPVIVDPWQ
jgi:hypothetical protein